MSPVFLNVYDLTPNNYYVAWCGIGIFHAGVDVYGTEYAYGGHEYDCTGVFATSPRDAPGQVFFRESIYMGETNFSPAEVQQLVYKMGEAYRGNKYHLLQRNCNNFASDLAYQLVGKPAPSWINRLASIAITLHCLLPVSWVPPLQAPSEDKDTKRLLMDGGLRSDDFNIDVSTNSHTAFSPPSQSSIVCPPSASPSNLVVSRS
uniref:PPPDE domain-containing protein n=1 Tax=Dunaliella tertiolecta TaxID=3047 RepID=A0A7S3RAL3_DUNTE|mmetsp:Transcript_293/g.688  ORF Transcript_293/g.688 Transcript_293/m.688 type:complete len:204 (-) Transcript_293:1520-2131(-)|eukprot:CAMPEP_0202360474 /NCGR_PEP_ID=MMETSP1126-20121109/13402_1 /ASSEMBLY_ACC=CAM_ASM_000457 /TAXON_ID=3047 /ORGANISM="Dunaliella tertiolecta, Strain CCMP1320" /LENGTH=203 /DNA_ID=CAMNT_0048954193 /DNA_START=228 /DNA_END=839 /DNA_ORIENTATION=+